MPACICDVIKTQLIARPVLGGVSFLKNFAAFQPVQIHPRAQRKRFVRVEISGWPEADFRFSAEFSRFPRRPILVDNFPAHDFSIQFCQRIGQVAIERIVRRQPLARRFRQQAETRLLPFISQCQHLFLRHCRQNPSDLVIEFVQLSLLLGRGQLQHRVGISFIAIEPSLRHGIEERKESIKILLLDRIILVIVTPRATHGESQPSRCRGARAVHHILHVVLFGDRAAFEIEHVIAVKSARDSLLDRRVRKQVTG